jgi:hypothetical protein
MNNVYTKTSKQRNLTDPNNWRGIMLLSVTSKELSKIILVLPELETK